MYDLTHFVLKDTGHTYVGGIKKPCRQLFGIFDPLPLDIWLTPLTPFSVHMVYG